MGLDLTLAALVLIAGVRGWFKGFFLQVIGLAALIACVYLADPLRDLARPHARQYLASIQPELLDKLLWWISAVVAFLVLGGVGRGVLSAYRRRPRSEFEPDEGRGDQGAGFLLGAVKGGIVAAFLAAAVAKHAPEYLKAGGPIAQQVQTSRALAWSEQYRPAEKIWSSAPVQAFVGRIRDRGLWNEPAAVAAPTSPTEPEPAPVRTAERPKALVLPNPPAHRLQPDDPDFLHNLDDALRREGLTKSR